MHIQDLILLVIGNEKQKRLRGRTTLQKKLYFLSVLNETNLGFRPHYYGPYSSEVAENLDTLVSTGFLKEVTETLVSETSTVSRDRNIFGEIRRHTYSLTPDGKTVMKEIEQEDGYMEWVKALNLLNRKLSNNYFNTLSIAAKVYYIVNQQGSATREQIRNIAEKYGWNINHSQIEKVLSLLENLTLISVK